MGEKNASKGMYYQKKVKSIYMINMPHCFTGDRQYLGLNMLYYKFSRQVIIHVKKLLFINHITSLDKSTYKATKLD